MLDAHQVFKEYSRIFLSMLQNALPISAFNIVCEIKTFIGPHLAYNNFFYQFIEPIKYNACIEIKRVIKGTSRGFIYQELHLEFLQR